MSLTVEDKGAWEEVFSYARSLADLPGTPSDAPTKGDIHWVSRRLQRNPSLVNSNPTFRNQVEAIVRFVSERADVRVEAALEKTLIWLSREKDARDSAALQRDSRRFGSAEEAVFPLVDHILPSPSPWRSLLEQLDRFGYTPDDQRRLIHFVIQHNLLTVFPERRNFCHTRADVIQPLLRHSNLFDDSRSIQARALAFFLRNLGSGVAYRLELIPNSESLVIAEGWMFSVEDIRINAYVFLDHPENLPEVFDILQGSDIDRPFRLVKIFYEGNDIRREELKRLVNSYAPEGRFGGSVQKLQGSTVEIEATGSGLDPSTSLPSTSLRASEAGRAGPKGAPSGQGQVADSAAGRPAENYARLFRDIVHQALRYCLPVNKGGAPLEEVRKLFEILNASALSSADPMILKTAKRIADSGVDSVVREPTERLVSDLSEEMARDDFYKNDEALARLQVVCKFVQKNGEPKDQADATTALGILGQLEKLPPDQRVDVVRRNLPLLAPAETAGMQPEPVRSKDSTPKLTPKPGRSPMSAKGAEDLLEITGSIIDEHTESLEPGNPDIVRSLSLVLGKACSLTNREGVAREGIDWLLENMQIAVPADMRPDQRRKEAARAISEISNDLKRNPLGHLSGIVDGVYADARLRMVFHFARVYGDAALSKEADKAIETVIALRQFNPEQLVRVIHERDVPVLLPSRKTEPVAASEAKPKGEVIPLAGRKNGGGTGPAGSGPLAGTILLAGALAFAGGNSAEAAVWEPVTVHAITGLSERWAAPQRLGTVGVREMRTTPLNVGFTGDFGHGPVDAYSLMPAPAFPIALLGAASVALTASMLSFSAAPVIGSVGYLSLPMPVI